jgi:hypothetical protein
MDALPPRVRRVALAAIVITAAAVQLRNLAQDLPLAPFVDEPYFVRPAARMAQGGGLDPGWFGHPGSTFIYPLAAASRLARTDFDSNPQRHYMIGRGLSVGYALAALLLAYVLMRRWFSDAVGLITAWLLSATPLVVDLSRMARTDGAALFATLLALVFLLRTLEQPTVRHFALAGVGVGLAAATKYPLATVSFIAPVAAVLAVRRGALGAGAALGRVLMAGAIAVLVFAVCTPFFFLSWHAVWRDLAAEAAPAETSSGSYVRTLFWYGVVAPHELVGWLQTPLVLAGAVIAWRKGRVARVLLLVPLVFVVVISTVRLTWHHWYLPVLAVLHALVGLALVTLARRLPAPRVWWVVAALVLGVIQLREAVPSDEPTTRQAARQWAFDHLPAGTRVAQELDMASWMTPLADPYPTGVLAARYQGKSLVVAQALGSLVELGTLERLRCDGYTHLMLNASRAVRLSRESPDRYGPFYRRIEAEGRLLAEFPRRHERSGPTIRIVDIGHLACR